MVSLILQVPLHYQVDPCEGSSIQEMVRINLSDHVKERVFETWYFYFCVDVSRKYSETGVNHIAVQFQESSINNYPTSEV